MASDRAGVDKVSGTSAGLRCAGVFPVKAKPLARRARGLGTRHTQASTEHSAAGPPSHPAPFAPKTGGLGSGERAATVRLHLVLDARVHCCPLTPRCDWPTISGARGPVRRRPEHGTGWAGTGPVRCIAGGRPGGVWGGFELIAVPRPKALPRPSAPTNTRLTQYSKRPDQKVLFSLSGLELDPPLYS